MLLCVLMLGVMIVVVLVLGRLLGEVLVLGTVLVVVLVPEFENQQISRFSFLKKDTADFGGGRKNQTEAHRALILFNVTVTSVS